MPGQRRSPIAMQPQPSAPIVAQQLSDLLLSFPAAAMGGVQWQVLVHKYEERHSTRLDLAMLGHSSPLAAATALLWDVLRMVDREDTDNPVVGIEDAVALVPQPGQLGSWPSLYRVLCNLVLSNGSLKAADKMNLAQDGSDTQCLLLSQLRPLLEYHWHASFDESALGFLNEEGTFLKLKKMKHLLHAVIRWREQRQAWQREQGLKPSAVDEALIPHLELVVSSKHNDLLLVCSPRGASTQKASPGASGVSQTLPAVDKKSVESSAPDARTGGAKVSAMQRELEQLREENERLRSRNDVLEQSGVQQMPGTPVVMMAATPRDPPTQLPADIFDDPFEPPPEVQAWRPEAFKVLRTPSLDLSTNDAGSECSFEMSTVASYTTELQSTSAVTSGAATPVHAVPMAQQGCTFVPVWFPLMQYESQAPWSVIPQGIVKTACTHFERLSVMAGN